MSISKDGSERPDGPFSGLLIVDLTHVLAGPFCTMLFADLGARVIKVERPKTGDDSRAFGPFLNGKSLYFAFINRGKESIALDLKNEKDRGLFEELVRRADVVVENFRPGTMDKLGYTYQKLSEINPRIVYASCSGFGQTGPMSKEPAYDAVVQGLSGLMSITGFPDGPPTRVGTSISDLSAGLFCFCAIASALYAREKSGKGARVDVAMLDGMMTLLESGVEDYVAYGRVPERIGNRNPSITPFDTYQAKDRSFIICAGDNELFIRLSKAIGKPELASDKRFATNEDRTTNQAELKQILETVFSSESSSYWIQLVQKAGVPCGPIHNIREAVEHEQVKARNMMITAGGVRMPGNPIKISGFVDPTTRPAAPDLDADGAHIRQKLNNS